MRTGLHMTIQDYLMHSGLITGHCRSEGPVPADVKPTDHLFGRILDEQQRSARAGQSGLGIQDYFARPLTARHQAGPNSPAPGGTEVTNPIAPGPAPAPYPQASPVVSTPPSAMAEPTSQVRRADVAVQNRIEAGITKAAERYDLPEALIRAVVQAESGFKVRAVSPAGARGLMQLMPGTAKEMGVTDPFDIEQNIDGGSRYLRTMLDRFDGDVRLALSAYNAGPGTVAKYNGRVPYAETRNYVDRVLRFVRLSA
jgi:soluble lytic murein transglycosylase-like protein